MILANKKSRIVAQIDYCDAGVLVEQLGKVIAYEQPDNMQIIKDLYFAIQSQL